MYFDIHIIYIVYTYMYIYYHELGTVIMPILKGEKLRLRS